MEFPRFNFTHDNNNLHHSLLSTNRAFFGPQKIFARITVLSMAAAIFSSNIQFTRAIAYLG